MYSYSNDGYDGWSTRKAAEDCVKRIREIEDKGNSKTNKEIAELKELKDSLDEYRKKCSHIWNKIPLFFAVRKICGVCEEEDRTYNYSTDKEWNRPKL